MTYDELMTELEEAWIQAGFHEHLVVESVVPDALERLCRAELFADPPESFTTETTPPWVEVFFRWTAEHQVYSEESNGGSSSLELAWTYTVDVRLQPDRSDIELIRAFQAAVHSALQCITEAIPQETEYVAVEVRRGYRSMHTNPTLAYVQMIGTNVINLGHLRSGGASKDLRRVLQRECRLVMAVLQSLKEVFAK